MRCCGGGGVANDRYSTFSDACYTGNLEKVKEQLKLASDKQKQVNQKGKDGLAPIHRAAQKGNEEIISFLIDNKVDVNALTQYNETALHIACFHRKLGAVVKLLENGSKKSINVVDTQHGMTALHVSIYRGSPDITEVLMKAGADQTIRDKNGHTALETAEFWATQADAGLASPSANHRGTRAVVLKLAAC